MSDSPHLETIASSSRAAGSVEETRARAYVAAVLRRASFTVHEEEFQYSALPGMYGTPMVGVLAVITVVSASALSFGIGNSRISSEVLAVGLALVIVLSLLLLGDGVLRIPLLRRTSTNLVATRGGAEPRVWLVAHIDSKSQPIPSAVRVAGIVTLGLGVASALLATALTLAGEPSRMVWWVAAVLAVAGGIPVASSTIGNDSHGAVDNASGVAAVLFAAERARSDLCFGVLVTSAEELGLAGARAWSKNRKPGIALNVDGVDDKGRLVIMHSGRSQTELVELLKKGDAQIDVRRMPPGLLTDSVALSARGWKSVTISHGSAATLGRVHSSRDSLKQLSGVAIEIVGNVLLIALECIACM